MTPEKIKETRLNLRLTQASFAKKLGVTRRAVESWEQGRRVASSPVLKLIEFILEEHKKTQS